MANIVKGKYLYVSGGTSDYIGAYATSHTISLSADTEDIAYKGDNAGLWKKSEVSGLSWEITSENLVPKSGLNLPTIGDDVSVTVSAYLNAAVNGSNTSLGSASALYSGTGIVTSLELSGAVGDNATYSITITGNGPLTKS